MLFTQVGTRNGRRRTVLTGYRNTISHIMLHTSSHIIFTYMIRVFPLKSFYSLNTHFSIHQAIFTIILPHTRPSRITSQIYYRSISPWNAPSLRFISRDFSPTTYQLTVKSCSHIHTLRKQSPVKRISSSMNLVYSINTGNPDLLHRLLLNLTDCSSPYLLFLCYTQRHIQDRSHFILTNHRIQHRLTQFETILTSGEIGYNIHCYFTHLAHFLLKCHLFQPSLNMCFNH